MIEKEIIIIGAGIAGLEAGNSLLNFGKQDFVILEKESTIIKQNSWKSFPNVVKDFNLEDCVARDIDRIFFRAVNVDEMKVISSNSPEIKCYVLDSNKIYQKYQSLLSKYIQTNIIIKDIQYLENIKQYMVSTNKVIYYCTYLIDASGSKAVLDDFFQEDWFRQKAFYLCYAKRYSNCNVKQIEHDAYFDFDDPQRYCGCWCYPFADGTAEIGVARFTNKFGISEKLKTELDGQIEQYKKLMPFKKVFTSKSTQIGDSISGFCALLPRIKIEKDNRFFIGDTKGAVTYSGYGTENAFRSARKVAESIAFGKKYDYFITPPSAGLAILKLLWNLDPDRLKKQAEGISMLSNENIQKFFQGNIDLSFFMKANKISKKLGNNLISELPKDMIFRILFNKMPIKKDYKDWI